MAKDMDSILMQTRLGAVPQDGPRCSSCGRSPLVGERMHVFDSGTTACSLCAPRLVASEGEPVADELVRSTARRLAVVQQRAA